MENQKFWAIVKNDRVVVLRTGPYVFDNKQQAQQLQEIWKIEGTIVEVRIEEFV